MKRNVFILSILLPMLVFAIKIDKASANELEEFKAALERYTNACKNLDAEAMAEIEAEAIGFSSSGRMHPRDHATMDKERRIAELKRYRSKFEVFEWITTYDIVKVVGNTGIACGRTIDKMKPIGGELETIQGRLSVTYLKKNGQWKLILYHRDIPANK